MLLTKEGRHKKSTCCQFHLYRAQTDKTNQWCQKSGQQLPLVGEGKEQ